MIVFETPRLGLKRLRPKRLWPNLEGLKIEDPTSHLFWTTLFCGPKDQSVGSLCSYGLYGAYDVLHKAC